MIYGHSRLDSDYKAKFLGARKIVRAALRLNVVEVATGEML